MERNKNRLAEIRGSFAIGRGDGEEMLLALLRGFWRLSLA